MKNLLMNRTWMNKLVTSKVFVGISTFLMSILVPVTAFASNASASSDGSIFDAVVNPTINLIDQILGPVLGVVGAVGAVYCVILGVKFAKAEDPQEHEKAKNHLKNAIIGFVLIFVLMLALKLGMKPLYNWYVTTQPATTTAN